MRLGRRHCAEMGQVWPLPWGGGKMDFLNCKKDRMGINKRIYLRERVIKGRGNQWQVVHGSEKTEFKNWTIKCQYRG